VSISELQKKSAQAVVNIFETGAALGDYGKVTVLPGDTGHLTYGRAQTTLASGNLFLLIKRYVSAAGAAFRHHLEPYLQRLQDQDVALDFDATLRGLLEAAGNDPVMQDEQDRFFDDAYWVPAQRAAEALGLKDALAISAVYDSHIHGSWRFIKDRTLDRHGQPTSQNGHVWIKHYVRERRDWLASHNNRLLRKTVYRMDTFLALMEAENWALDLPFVARGVRVDADTLHASAPVRVTAEDAGLRTLRLTDPPMSGGDVKALEEVLIEVGYAINVDGIFDASLERIVRERQQELGLGVDGMVGPMTRSALGL
jgi:chitosanase